MITPVGAGVMVPSGQQRGTGRRAKRRLCEIGCAAGRCGRDDPSTGSGSGRRRCCWRPKPDVVGHDQQDVGRAFGRSDRGRKVRRGILSVAVDVPMERRLRRRQDDRPAAASWSNAAPFPPRQLATWPARSPLAASPARCTEGRPPCINGHIAEHKRPKMPIKTIRPIRPSIIAIPSICDLLFLLDEFAKFGSG